MKRVITVGLAITLLIPALARADQQTSAQKPDLRIRNTSIKEGDSGAKRMKFTVKLSEEPNKKVVVRYKTVKGTAKPGKDYKAKRGKLRFRPGVTTKKLKVKVFGDTKNEGKERFKVKLAKARNARIDKAKARGTIRDNDGGSSNCDPSYPDVCIPPPPPDLNCSDIEHRQFTVEGDDPHGFDTDGDGVGCES